MTTVRSILSHPAGQRCGRVPMSRPWAVAVLHVQHAPRHRVRVEQHHFIQQHSSTYSPVYEHMSAQLQHAQLDLRQGSILFAMAISRKRC